MIKSITLTFHDGSQLTLSSDQLMETISQSIASLGPESLLIEKTDQDSAPTVKGLDAHPSAQTVDAKDGHRSAALGVK